MSENLRWTLLTIAVMTASYWVAGNKGAIVALIFMIIIGKEFDRQSKKVKEKNSDKYKYDF